MIGRKSETGVEELGSEPDRQPLVGLSRQSLTSNPGLQYLGGRDEMLRSFATDIGDAPITIETGKLAGQANGAVTVRCGDTIILVTATCSKSPREGVDFLPLTVDYEERLYAAGRIPGGFFKREGRPSEQAILLCRLVDRPMRPLFPGGYRNDVQIIITALSADQEHYLDILSIIGASAALTISDIPFAGPVGAVRVGYIDGELVFNPTASQMERSSLDLRIVGTADAIMTLEGEGNEVPEELMAEAVEKGSEVLQDTIQLQLEMQRELGKPKQEFVPSEISDELRKAVREHLAGRIDELFERATSKEERDEALSSTQDELVAELGEEYEEKDIVLAMQEVVRERVRANILEKGMRTDGRDLGTVRSISTEVGFLPRAHGSGVFTRGQTQVLTITTLGTAADEKKQDTLVTEEPKRFMHHYNFLPYSTGETWPLRGPRRREIGHGALAERALLPVIPSEEEFPYTIRLVSEVLSSDGSTSMASVCASTLSLMDAGVSLKAPVAGIGMGLVKEQDDYRILTDIQGIEDAFGDMDFKVAGTAKGITAIQLDVKIRDISPGVIKEALEGAKEARLLVLDIMLQTLTESRADISLYAPRITRLKVDPDKIGLIIGGGGRTIRRIEELGVKVELEDDGTVFIASSDKESNEKAVLMIEALTAEAEIGQIYMGTVKRTINSGAFVEILPGKDGYVHISQLADYRVPSVEEVVQVGDEVMVMVIDIDPQGRIRLSRRAALEGWTATEAKARAQRDRRRPSRGRGGEKRGFSRTYRREV